jgi:hypothetical protein
MTVEQTNATARTLARPRPVLNLKTAKALSLDVPATVAVFLLVDRLRKGAGAGGRGRLARA